MERDSRGLIHNLVTQVVLASKEGLSARAFLNHVHKFQEDKTVARSSTQVDSAVETDLFISSAPPKTALHLDSLYLESIWSQLQRHKDIEVISTADGSAENDASSDQDEFLVRHASDCLVASEAKTWDVLTGHQLDHKRIPRLEFECLRVIASYGPAGLLQPDLTRITGQDKRSVPKRTDALAAKGHITKEACIGSGAKTSLLRWKKFEVLHGQGALTSLVDSVSARENNVTTNKATIVVCGRWFDMIVDVLTSAQGGTAPYQSILQATGANGKRQLSRTLCSCIRRLVGAGLVRRLLARGEEEVKPTTGRQPKQRWVKCVKILRAPNQADRDLFYASLKRDSAYMKERAAMKAAADDDTAVRGEDDANDDNDASEHETDDTEDWNDDDTQQRDERSGPEESEPPNTLVHAPPQGGVSADETSVALANWTPDLHYSNLLFNAVDSAGPAGMHATDVAAATGGDLWRRPFDDTILRLTDWWYRAQPPELRHLSILRDTTIEGQLSQYKFRSWQNFAEAVRRGEASWEYMLTEPEIEQTLQTQPTLDEWGFPVVPLNEVNVSSPSVAQCARLGVKGKERIRRPQKTVRRTVADLAAVDMTPTLQTEVEESNQILPPTIISGKEDALYGAEPGFPANTATGSYPSATTATMISDTAVTANTHAVHQQLIKRPRGRPRKNYMPPTSQIPSHGAFVAINASQSTDLVQTGQLEGVTAASLPAAATAKRPRSMSPGLQVSSAGNADAIIGTSHDDQGPPLKRKRGRPPKSKTTVGEIIEPSQLINSLAAQIPAKRKAASAFSTDDALYQKSRIWSQRYDALVKAWEDRYAGSDEETRRALPEHNQPNCRLPPGVYLGQPRASIVHRDLTNVGRGRPPKTAIVTFRSDRLQSLDWFKPDGTAAPSQQLLALVPGLDQSNVAGIGVDGTTASTKSTSESVYVEAAGGPGITDQPNGDAADYDANGALGEGPPAALMHSSHEQIPTFNSMAATRHAPQVLGSMTDNLTSHAPQEHKPPETPTRKSVRRGPYAPREPSLAVDIVAQTTSSASQILRNGSVQDVTTRRPSDAQPGSSHEQSLTPGKQQTRRRPRKPHTTTQPAVKAAGGIVEYQRNKILLEIFQRCDGVFPGRFELYHAFASLWHTRFGHVPDRSTLYACLSGNVAAQRLKYINISFVNAQHHTVTKDILAIAQLSRTDPTVLQLQANIKAAWPKSYMPPQIIVTPQLRELIAKKDDGPNQRLSPAKVKSSAPEGYARDSSTVLKVSGGRVRLELAPGKSTQEAEHFARIRAAEAELAQQAALRDLAREQNRREQTSPHDMSSQDHVVERVGQVTSQEPAASARKVAANARLDAAELVLPAKEHQRRKLAAHWGRSLGSLESRKARWAMVEGVSHDLGTGEGPERDLVQPTIDVRAPQQTFHETSGTFGTLTTSAGTASSMPNVTAERPLIQAPLPVQHGDPAITTRIAAPEQVGTDSMAIDMRNVPRHILAKSTVPAPATAMSNPVPMARQDAGNAKNAQGATPSRGLADHPAMLSASACRPSDEVLAAAPPLDLLLSWPRPNTEVSDEPVMFLGKAVHPGVRYVDTELSGVYITRTKDDTVMSLKDEKRLLVAIAVVRTLLGGLQQEARSINYACVNHAMHFRFDGKYCREQWNKLRAKQDPYLAQIQRRFREAFLEAYERGDMPDIDLWEPENTDWAYITDWAMQRVDQDTQAQSGLLPATRTAFDAGYEIELSDRAFAIDTNDMFSANISTVRKDFIAYSVGHHNPMQDVGHILIRHADRWTLLLAQSWIRANVLTDKKAYNSTAAMRKLGALGSDIIKRATDIMLGNRMIKGSNKQRNMPGRNFIIADELKHIFVLPWQWEYSLFETASRYMSKLDRHFTAQKGKDGGRSSFPVGDEVGNAQALVLVSLIERGRVRIENELGEINHDVDAPFPKLSKWGLLDGGYKSIFMKMERLRFVMEVFPTKTYFDEDGQAPRVRSARLPLNVRFDEDGGFGERLPYWTDIQGSLVVNNLRDLLLTVLYILIHQPTLGTDTMAKILSYRFWAWELDALLGWAAQAGLVCRNHGPCGGREDGWELGEWWWLAADAVAMVEREMEQGGVPTGGRS